MATTNHNARPLAACSRGDHVRYAVDGEVHTGEVRYVGVESALGPAMVSVHRDGGGFDHLPGTDTAEVLF